jgi:uncharacterized repeat protein (TIGR01451 family)
LNSYTKAAATATNGQRRFQVIRVPQVGDATLTSSLTGLPWNGSVGGVLAVDVAGTLNLNGATVSVDGLGFRGRAGRQLSGAGGLSNTDYRAPAATAANGQKGEGYAGTPRFLWDQLTATVVDTGVDGYPNGSSARGAPGNAGGGGTDGRPSANDQNSGGGGGGGAAIAGRGGNTWGSNLPRGGIGGVGFAPSATAIVAGGGGGAGTRNNSSGIDGASSGARGGGIIAFRVGAVTGTGTLRARGLGAFNGTDNDGGGGGGAGGTTIFTGATPTGLTAQVDGGRGGDAWATQAPGSSFPGNRHGPGGGGGGGAILTSGVPTAVSVAGGNPGITTTANDPFGAQPGSNGVAISTLTRDSIPGVDSGAECAVDLAVTKAGPSVVVSGGTASYTVTVSNTGPATVETPVTWTDALPAGTTFASLSAVAGWTCTTPPVNGTGTIACTRSAPLPPGPAATWTLVVNVTTGSGTIANTASTTTSGPQVDINTANNSSTTTATVVTLDAVDDAFSTVAGTAVAGSVASNDSYPSGSSFSVVASPGNGSVTMASDGSFTYTPNPGFSGVDTFTYTIQDSSGNTDTATVTITVTNNPPVAVEDDATVGSNQTTLIAVLANDSDPDGHSLTVTSVGPSAAGATVSVGPANTLSYTPPFNFTGYDLVPYTITDGYGGYSTALVRIRVAPGSGFVPNDRMTRIGIGGTIPGTGPGTYDQYTVAGDLRLNLQSELLLTLRDGFFPVPGDTFDVVVGGSLGGAYGKIHGQIVSNGTTDLVLDVQYLPDRVRVIARPAYFVDRLVDSIDAMPGDGTCQVAALGCTLRAAVQEINASGPGAVVLPPNQMFHLTVGGAGEDAAVGGDLDLTTSAAVIGQGSTVDAAGIDGVFHLLGGQVTMSRLTVTGGTSPTGTAGGITGSSASLWLTDVTVTGNSGATGGGLGISGGSLWMTRGALSSNTTAADGGGALLTGATAVLDSVTVNGNTAGVRGGGIAASGPGVIIRSTTVEFNTASVGGGIDVAGSLSGTSVMIRSNTAATGAGINATGGPLTLTDARLTSNTASGNGGGLALGSSVSATLSRVTVDNNSAAGDGGGIHAGSGSSLTIATSTLSGNAGTSGAALYQSGGSAAIQLTTITRQSGSSAVALDAGATVSFQTSVVADQLSGVNCAVSGGTITSLNFNLSSDTSCGLAMANDVQGMSANLGPLVQSTGYGPVHIPNVGSATINTGPSSCPGPDQRNWPRPRAKKCEKGSVEV